MIDLDAIWTEGDELYCQFALAIWLDGKFGYYDWCALTMGLDLYIRVEPEDQVASDELVDALIAYYRNQSDPRWLSKVQTFISCCDGSYPLAHQERMAELILERVAARMAKSPENCAIITEQEL